MVTYTRTPQRFAPAGNPVTFSVSGTSSDILLYQTQIVEASSQAVIYTGNIYPKPLTPSYANINLSNQLQSLVRADVDNTNSIFISKTRPILGYQIATTEYGVSGGTLTQLGSATTSDTHYVIDAEVDSFNYTTRFTGDSYVLTSGQVGKFLTLQPDNKVVNDYSFEQLYFIQSGYTGVTVSVTANNGISRVVVYTESITGSTPYLISAGTSEVRAMGSVTITGSCSANDNIGIYLAGNLVAAYTAATSGLTTSVLANNIYNTIGSISGYNITNTGSTIYIQAPVGTGAGGNSISLTTSVITASSTGSTVTSETKATVDLGGYTNLPGQYDISYVTVVDASLGNLDLYTGTVFYPIATIDDYTATLVDFVNTNTYGYSATQLTYNTFRIIARVGLGDTQNGLDAQLFIVDLNETYTSTFAGGSTLGTSGVTYYHSVVPNSVSGFSGGVNATADVSGYTMDNLFRVQTSPKKLIANGVTGLTVGYEYDVRIKDGLGNTISEVRTYQYEDDNCGLEYVNVIFTNSFGGVDSYQFINPQESVNVTKNTIKKNNINLDSDTPFITDGVYNTIDQTYSNNGKSNIRVWTQELSDDESSWLTELVKSKNIFIELTDGNLVPVQLDNTNYNIQRKKYIKNQLNQYQFEFSFSNDFLPALSSAGIIING